MRILLVVIALACVGSAVAGGGGENWKEFASKEDGFSIAFPGPPATRPGIAFWREKEEKPFWLLASSEKRATNFKDKKVAREFLQGGQAGILNKHKGKLLKEQSFEQDGRLGRDFSFQPAEHGFVRTQLLLIENRLFVLYFYAESEALLRSKAAEHYFASFKVLK
jgi:hypothetical protein